MPAWLISLGGPLLKSLFGGLFGWLDGAHKESLRQRAIQAEAERESVKQAAADERRIRLALQAGRQIKTAEDWNKAMEDPWFYV